MTTTHVPKDVANLIATGKYLNAGAQEPVCGLEMVQLPPAHQFAKPPPPVLPEGHAWCRPVLVRSNAHPDGTPKLMGEMAADASDISFDGFEGPEGEPTCTACRKAVGMPEAAPTPPPPPPAKWKGKR